METCQKITPPPPPNPSTRRVLKLLCANLQKEFLTDLDIEEWLTMFVNVRKGCILECVTHARAQ